MGTRSRINIIDGNQVLVSVYRQFDGYPSGIGAEILEFAKDMTITNGISGDRTLGASANGMGCFAAQLIKAFKDEVGNVYIRDTSEDSHGEEYSYNISQNDDRLHLQVLSGSMTMFGAPGDKEAAMDVLYSGPLDHFDPATAEAA